jgi:hypothetical protein
MRYLLTWDYLRLMSTPNHRRHFGALGATASGIKVSSGGVDVDLVRDLLKPLGDSAQCAGQEPTFLRRQIGAALNHMV